MQDKYLMDGHKLLWHLDRVDAWLKGEKIAPIHIDVGLSKGCNIKCEYCFGAMQGNFYRKGSEIYFPREPLLRYMRDAGAVGVRSMALIGEAEPLLNPHAYEAIVAGKKAGVDIALGTNGILFDTSSQGCKALESLSWIRFNISAASDSAYRKIHRSTEFAVAIDKIRFCVAYKNKKKLDLTIGLQMVLTPNNVGEAVPLAKLGRQLGVDYLVVKQCSDSVKNELGIFKQLGKYEKYSDILTEAENLSDKDYSVIIKWRKITNKGLRDYNQCLGVPFLLYSSGDGKLYPCGMFFNYKEKEYRMGDLVKQSFKEILESRRYWQVVEKVSRIDVSKCYSNCRTHAINDFVFKLKSRPKHVNFV